VVLVGSDRSHVYVTLMLVNLGLDDALEVPRERVDLLLVLQYDFTATSTTNEIVFRLVMCS
jgi:hypothetical protein